MDDPRDRAAGALVGLAVGDALGMPTQNFPRALVLSRYGLLDDFLPGPPDNEISAGTPAGHVTDDTDQAVILGRLFVEGGGRVDPDRLAAELLAWEARMRAAGSLDLLGPSTRRALRLIAEGVPPGETGRWGDTNGAAMRVAPVGVGTPASVEAVVDAVEQAGRVTHDTGVAIAGASAVAMAVSAGVAGHGFEDSVARAVDAARIGAERGSFVAGADVASRIEWAISLVRGLAPERAADLIYDLVGAGLATQEAVPAAFAVASLFPDDAWLTCRHAASLGGDCDTIAAMAGAIVGAHTGASSIPRGVRERLDRANPELGLEALADDLLALRERSDG